MFRKLAIAFASFLLILLVVSFFLPSKWTVERSILIQAPSSAIYPMISNFRNGWSQWSEFDKEDPTIIYSFSGPEEGVGSTRSWSSENMGMGQQKILKAEPNYGVHFELIMDENAFHLDGYILFEPQGDATKVVWRDEGDVGQNPMHKYMVLFADKMMGPVFEKSLQNLKNKVEATPETPLPEE